ncbi:hypothetical protein BDP81DRAFT_42931 [Colletotrichum phormii]|uniref:Uncharacterized protein n=1 Tax=Colletotrichum phormii TaxID=359342 RepID=A0AAJ0EDG0_9PEZI|nr:uncharacterized protein BDP81DRAFT_42931 [Colletotrichum phormii]KAK1635857.1 hypothetical protein BDP81DRAFT_42931 [Colletotrichum phormii]
MGGDRRQMRSGRWQMAKGRWVRRYGEEDTTWKETTWATAGHAEFLAVSLRRKGRVQTAGEFGWFGAFPWNVLSKVPYLRRWKPKRARCSTLMNDHLHRARKKHQRWKRRYRLFPGAGCLCLIFPLHSSNSWSPDPLGVGIACLFLFLICHVTLFLPLNGKLGTSS